MLNYGGNQPPAAPAPNTHNAYRPVTALEEANGSPHHLLGAAGRNLIFIMAQTGYTTKHPQHCEPTRSSSFVKRKKPGSGLEELSGFGQL
jgi:hypothetical protein